MRNKLESERRGHCPNCGPDKWATVKGHFQHSYDHDEAPMRIHEEWFLLFCPACKEAYMTSEPSYSEYFPIDDTGEEGEHHWEGNPTQWPKPYTWARPSWLPVLQTKNPDLHSLVEELYTALDANLKVLSGIGMRTVFESTAEMLGVKQAGSFSDKLKSLTNDQHIGGREHELLSKLTEAGNAAAHRGWAPSNDELEEMMSILTAFLQRSVVAGTTSLSHPPRPARRSA